MNTPGSGRMAQWLEEVWLNRYLDRELDDDEQASFEAYMLDKPHLLEQVDADTRLRDGVARSEDARAPRHAVPPQHSAATLRGKQRGPLLAVAASLAIGVGVGALLPSLGGNGEMIVASPPRIVFDTLRGDGATTIEEAGHPDATLLIVDIAAPIDDRILAASVVLDGNRVPLPTPAVSAEGFATFVVPRDWRGRATIELRTDAHTLSYAL
jgi:anti-sigma factor RsiW